MSVRFLLDEHISPCLMVTLAEWGHDAHGVAFRQDLAGADDAQVLQAATRERRVLITSNAEHFEALREAAGVSRTQHAGIIVCREQDLCWANFRRSLKWFRRLLRDAGEGDLTNALHYLHTFGP
jgi:hypothetical protein